MNKLSWTKSHQKCQEEGSILAAVSDEDTSEFLTSLYLWAVSSISSFRVESTYWIGGKRFDSFQWLDGTDFTNTGFSAGCLRQMKDSGRILDGDCSEERPFVCQLPAGNKGNCRPNEGALAKNYN